MALADITYPVQTRYFTKTVALKDSQVRINPVSVARNGVLTEDKKGYKIVANGGLELRLEQSRKTTYKNAHWRDMHLDITASIEATAALPAFEYATLTFVETEPLRTFTAYFTVESMETNGKANRVTFRTVSVHNGKKSDLAATKAFFEI